MSTLFLPRRRVRYGGKNEILILTNFLVNTVFYKKIGVWWKQWMETIAIIHDGMSTLFLPAFLGLSYSDRCLCVMLEIKHGY